MEFSFESEDKYSEKDSYNDIITNLNLSPEVGKRNKALLKALCNTNIRNIFYYREKIKTENFWRYVYGSITLLFVVGIPFFIYLVTDNAAGGINLFRSTGSLVVTFVASLLAFHKLISSWIEKRKYRSLFHQAKVDLMNIVFGLVEDHQWQDNSTEGENTKSETYRFVTPGLKEDLISAIRRSREIVNNETRQFFEMSASPSFDLSAALTSSATTAKSLFTSFQSKKFEAEMNYLMEEEKEKREKVKALREASEKNEIDLRIISRKLKKLLEKENDLNDQIDNIELTEESDRTPQQNENFLKYTEQLEAIESELEELEDKYDELEITMELTQEKLSERT